MARLVQYKNGLATDYFAINQDTITIGRSKKNIICLRDAVVSGFHAEIFIEKNEKDEKVYFIQDLSSTNGLYINKHKVSCSQLKHKDKLRVGSNMFAFIYDTADIPPKPPFR